GDSRYHLWRSNECKCMWVTVGTFCKVTVERVHDCVFLFFLRSSTIPHTDTWSTCIGKYGSIQIFESLKQSIAFCSVAYLLRARVDTKLSFRHQSFFHRLAVSRISPHPFIGERVSCLPHSCL